MGKKGKKQGDERRKFDIPFPDMDGEELIEKNRMDMMEIFRGIMPDIMLIRPPGQRMRLVGTWNKAQEKKYNGYLRVIEVAKEVVRDLDDDQQEQFMGRLSSIVEERKRND